MTKKLYCRHLKVDVKKVQTTYNKVSGSRRKPPAVEVSKFGRAKTNTEAAEEWQAFFLEQGLRPEQPWITTGTNEELGLIFIYAAQKTDLGAIEVKLDPKTGLYATHFGAAFKESPALRPEGKVEAQYEPSLDKEGKPCLALKITGAAAKRAGAADPEEMAARAEVEAAKAEAKAAARKRIAAAKQVRAKKPEVSGGDAPPAQ
jgi:hypothetical protein